MKKIETAIIACAGNGTRFMPFTSVVPKQMLPIKNKPALHWLIDECIIANIEKVVIVVNPDDQIIPEYINYIKPKKIKVEVVIQDPSLPYGNGTPLISAKDHIDSEFFAYFYGDDIVWRIHNGLPYMIDKFRELPMIAVEWVPRHEALNYGIVYKDRGFVKHIVEKPKYIEDESSMVVYGRFIFPLAIYKHIDLNVLGKNNELWLNDTISRLAKSHTIETIELKGKWLTITDYKTYFKLLKYIV